LSDQTRQPAPALLIQSEAESALSSARCSRGGTGGKSARSACGR
jgi:hypothetical protein